MTASTKVDLNHNRISRLDGLDELAGALLPGNKRHQKAFLSIFVELKYAEDQFLPSLDWVAERCGVSRRVLETARAKMRRLGLIDHVSRFNKRHGYREGWVFSSRFEKSLVRLGELLRGCREAKDGIQEKKDRDLSRYL